jgi:hypothetical protein
MTPHCRIGRVKPKLTVITPDVNTVLVGQLEELTSLAKSGAIRSGVMATINRDGTCGGGWSLGNGHGDMDAILAIEFIKARFIAS